MTNSARKIQRALTSTAFPGLLILVAALVSPMDARAQRETAEQIKEKHDAYYRCINNIETKPRDAFTYCANYVKTYPNDDARLVEFASMFLSAFPKIDEYLRSVPASDFDEASKWTVYKPDLRKVIPSINDAVQDHKIEISRSFTSPNEDKLLARAEAVYEPRKAIEEQLFKGWRYSAQDGVDFPIGEPPWWGGRVDTIQHARLITSSAVLYYYDLSLRLRSNGGIVKPNSFTFTSTNLKYASSIKQARSYSLEGKVFEDVYVAEMTLTWDQVCGGLCGAGFTISKIVLFDAAGDIVHVALDSDGKMKRWIS